MSDQESADEAAARAAAEAAAAAELAKTLPPGATLEHKPEPTHDQKRIVDDLVKQGGGKLTAANALELVLRAPPEAIAKALKRLDDEERLAARLAGASGSPTMPWGTGPRPTDWKDADAGDDILAALEAEPELVEKPKCGLQYVDPKTSQVFPERCQLDADHPPSPGHRHGNIGWWR